MGTSLDWSCVFRKNWHHHKRISIRISLNRPLCILLIIATLRFLRLLIVLNIHILWFGRYWPCIPPSRWNRWECSLNPFFIRVGIDVLFNGMHIETLGLSLKFLSVFKFNVLLLLLGSIMLRIWWKMRRIRLGTIRILIQFLYKRRLLMDPTRTLCYRSKIILAIVNGYTAPVMVWFLF